MNVEQVKHSAKSCSNDCNVLYGHSTLPVISFFGTNRKRQVAMKGLLPQQGFTLIEIMISLLLGVFLLGGVIGIFLNTKQTYRVQDGLSRLQENGRYAMEFIGRDIRMADYRMCQTLTPPSLINVGPDTAITGTEGAADAANSGKDSPDSITVRWSEQSCSCLHPTIPVCVASDVPQNRFYDITAGSLQVANQDLVEGVENMQIVYGVDTDGNGAPNYYADAGIAGLPMSQVVAVRVSLLLRTIDDNIASKPLQYTYNGATVIPNDRRIRRVFSSTFALRNRIH
jgi:type IV pilus assembly protein PilW